MPRVEYVATESEKGQGTPVLSILIACYNISPYVIECLDSIFQQIDRRAEVVIYDDKSTDGCFEQVRQFVQNKGHDIVLIDGETNKGVSCARNELVQHARGTYVWFIDGDDALLPDSYKRIMACIETHSPDVVCFDFKRLEMPSQCKATTKRKIRCASFTETPGLHVCKDDSLFIASMRSGNLHPWSRVFRRALFGPDMMFPVGRVFEDVEVVPLLMSKAQSAFYLQHPVIHYRMRANSIVAASSSTKNQEVLGAILEMMRRRAQMKGPMGEGARRATTAYGAGNVHNALRSILRQKMPRASKRALLQPVLDDFFQIYRGGSVQLLPILMRERGLVFTYHFYKRLLQAHTLLLGTDATRPEGDGAK